MNVLLVVLRLKMGKAILYFPTVPAMTSYRLTFTFIGFNKKHILC